MQPAPEKRPEVVYRRTPEGGAGNVRAQSFESWRRGIAPAIIPLIVGFALLLGIFAGVGYLSVREMDSVTFQARDVGRQRSARLNLSSARLHLH